MKYLLIYDNPDLDERLEYADTDEKVLYLRKVTDADRDIARYAIINSGVTGKRRRWHIQDFFLLRLMYQITEDYNADRIEGDQSSRE